LLFCAFDAEMAETSGVQSGMIHYLLLGLLAMVVVIGVQVAGSVLIPAMLILPGTTALLLSRKLHQVFAIAIAAGLIGAGTPCCAAGGAGGGLGRFSFSHASQSMSNEKLKITNKIRRCVSMSYFLFGTGS